MPRAFRELYSTLEASVFDGPGTLPPEVRRGVADHIRTVTGASDAPGTVPDIARTFVDKIATEANTITDDDVDALREHYTEDEIFELIAVSATAAGTARLAIVDRLLEDGDAPDGNG